MKAELDLPLFLTSLRMAALDVASHADYCKGINASQAKEECQEAINLKNKAVQDVLYCRELKGKTTTGVAPVVFMLMLLKVFPETQLSGKYKMSGAVIFYRISEQVNVQKLCKCSVMPDWE